MMDVAKEITGFNFGVEKDKLKKLLMHLYDGIGGDDPYIIPQVVVQATISTIDDYEYKELVFKFAEKVR